MPSRLFLSPGFRVEERRGTFSRDARERGWVKNIFITASTFQLVTMQWPVTCKRIYIETGTFVRLSESSRKKATLSVFRFVYGKFWVPRLFLSWVTSFSVFACKIGMNCDKIREDFLVGFHQIVFCCKYLL